MGTIYVKNPESFLIPGFISQVYFAWLNTVLVRPRRHS